MRDKAYIYLKELVDEVYRTGKFVFRRMKTKEKAISVGISISPKQ